MRLALVHTIYSKRFASGIITYIDLLQRCFAAHYDVATMLGAPLKFFDNIHLERLKLIMLLTTYFQLRRFLARENPDILHTQGIQYPASRDIVLLRSNLPLIITQHGIALRTDTVVGMLMRLYLATIGRVVLRRAQAVIATSEFTRSSLAPYIDRQEKLHLIPTGVDTTLFRPCNAETQRLRRNRWRLPDHPSMIVVGRLAASKNIRTLLSALRYCSVNLSVVGGGWQQRYLAQLTRALNVEKRVFFFGRRTQREIAELYTTANLFVLVSRYEGIPLAMLEAMASGLPAIVSSVGGVAEVIDHGENSFLVPSTIRSRELGALVESLSHDPQRLQAVGDRARQTITNRFSLERMIEKTDAVYKTVLRGNRN